jgi:hypothetical protein
MYVDFQPRPAKFWTNWFHLGLMGIHLTRLTIDGCYFRQNYKEKLGTIREIKEQ